MGGFVFKSCVVVCPRIPFFAERIEIAKSLLLLLFEYVTVCFFCYYVLYVPYVVIQVVYIHIIFARVV